MSKPKKTKIKISSSSIYAITLIVSQPLYKYIHIYHILIAMPKKYFKQYLKPRTISLKIKPEKNKSIDKNLKWFRKAT